MKLSLRKKEGQGDALQRPLLPGIWRLFFIWGSIGLQSFGGGASTLLLIRQAFIEKHAWVEEEEFVRFWSLCLMTPGINLVGLTILIGRKLGGVRGIVASLTGLLLPSAVITCLLTAGFTAVEHQPVIQAILKGVIPATAGIMLLVGWNFARPLLQQGWNEGKLKLVFSLLFITVTVVAVIVFKITVVLVLLGAALMGARIFSVRPVPEVTPNQEYERKREEELL
jgi:chromate transporter